MEIMGVGTRTVWTAMAVGASDSAERSMRRAAMRNAALRRSEPAKLGPSPIEGLGASVDVRM
jgi:hypothetical protein